jgi:hypothetical protein
MVDEGRESELQVISIGYNDPVVGTNFKSLTGFDLQYLSRLLVSKVL